MASVLRKNHELLKIRTFDPKYDHMEIEKTHVNLFWHLLLRDNDLTETKNELCNVDEENEKVIENGALSIFIFLPLSF